LAWRSLLLLFLGLFPILAHSTLFPADWYTYSPTRTYYAAIDSRPTNPFDTLYPDFESAGQAIADAYIPPPGEGRLEATKKEGWSIALGTLQCNQGRVAPLVGSEYFSVTIVGYYQIPDGRVFCSPGGLVIVKASCPDGGYLFVGAPYYSGICARPNAYTITLAGGNEVEPSIGSETKTLPIIATVKDQSTGQPPANPVKVRVSLKVEDTKSGGHDHGDSTRPRGGIATVSTCPSDNECWSNPTINGVVKFKFKAPEASGKYTITATCDGCTNNPQTIPVDVKVAGLETIPASLFYSLNETGGSNVVIGAVLGNHTDNHYLKPEAAVVLWRIAAAFRFEKRFRYIDPQTNNQLVLHLNDASLKEGGVFDICAIPDQCRDLGVIAWAAPHEEHRRGSVVDVRANSKPGAILGIFTLKFKQLARFYGADPHLEGGATRHFHLRLFNRRE
jgi:hypothetical protein